MRYAALFLLCLTLAACSLVVENGTNWRARYRQAKSYNETAEKYGWRSPDEKPKVAWITTTTPDPCLVMGWSVRKDYSTEPAFRWLQKRHLLPVRRTKALLFAPAGRCLPAVP